MRLLTALAFCAGQGAASTPAHASADLSVVCDQVAAMASRQSGVPESVLRAISLTETGRKKNGAFRPWPWTVNMEGKGLWFDNEDEARAYVYREYKRGARSFDVGCFQINYKWHGQEFASIEEMFDPAANALYAARLLKSLFAELGTWKAAAGAYHSRTPEFATRYAARFERIHKDLSAPGEPDIPEIPDIVLAMAEREGGAATTREALPRANTYPLLQASAGASALGSLVPISGGAGVSLLGPVGGDGN
jgi:hypothetical protein